MISGKNIVLTGASSGIGLEVLKLIVKGGNNILAVSRTAEEKLGGFDKSVTAFNADVGSAEGVDSIFKKAEEVFDGGKIDIFIANAGFPYYEEYNYADWERVEKMFDTNTLSPIYTYSRYLEHLNGREGALAMTISAIGQMAMPGYAIYSATKFALQGFQQAIRLEKPKNLQLTCIYPIATETNFFRVANEKEFEKPFPVQSAEVVAKKIVRGIENGKRSVSPSALFTLSKFLMGVCPPVRAVYWKLEKNKLDRFTGKK